LQQSIEEKSQQTTQESVHTNKFLYKLSKYVYSEALIDGYIGMAGMERERFLKDLEKNKNSVKNNAKVAQIMSSVLIVLVNILTIGSLLVLKDYLSTITEQTFSFFLFAVATNTTITFALQILFLFTYGMTTLLGIFGSTNAFSFLETMPLSEKDVSKLVLFTFFRTLNIQFLAILLSFPVVVAITTQSLLATLAAFVASFFNLIFCMSLMIILCNFMAKKIFNLDQPSKFKTFLRMLVTIGYLVGAMTAGMIFNFIGEWVETLFIMSLSIGLDGSIINSVLCFVFYPYSLAYLFGLSVFPLDKLFLSQSWIIFVGFAFSAFVILRIFKKALRVLRSITRDVEVKGSQSSGSPAQPIMIIKKRPVQAIIKKDTTAIFRNFSSTLYMIMPIILPLTVAVSMRADFTDPIISLINKSMASLIYIGMSAIFLLMAVLGSETDSGNIMYSLPIRQKDIFKAKRTIIFIPLLLAQVPSILFCLTIENLNPIYLIMHFVSLGLICFFSSELVLDLFSVLFGRIRNQYILQNLNPTKKVLKVIIGAIVLVVISVIPLSITGTLSNYITDNLFLFSIEVIIALIELIIIRILSIRLFK
jgi:hypothetical protein